MTAAAGWQLHEMSHFCQILSRMLFSISTLELTELNMRNKRKQLSNDERVILDEPLPRKRRGEPLSEDAIRQRDAKRTVQLRVSRAKQKVQRMF